MIKSKAKRLLLVTNNMYAMRGGEKWAQELAIVLKETFEVEIIFPNSSMQNRPVSFKKIRGVCYGQIRGWAFKSMLRTSRFDFFVLSLSGFASLMSTILRSDIIYCISSNPMVLFNTILLSKIYGKRVIYGAHNPLFESILEEKAGWQGVIGRAVLSNVNALHTLNSDDYKAAKGRFPNMDVRLIPNFVYSAPATSKIKVNKERFTILFVGTLLKMEKGMDFLADIIEKTMRKTSQIYFNIIGSEGDSKELISGLIKKYPKNVKAFGYMNQKELKKQYSGANLFILTSRKETFGLSLLEAQAYGLPAISFDIGGPSDIICEDFQGKIIKKFDTKTFADTVSYYYSKWESNKSDYLSIKRKINNFIIKEFSKEKIIPKLYKLMCGK
jgi:glycosyltransferase involved in cell wall biosynthesis